MRCRQLPPFCCPPCAFKSLVTLPEPNGPASAARSLDEWTCKDSVRTNKRQAALGMNSRSSTDIPLVGCIPQLMCFPWRHCVQDGSRHPAVMLLRLPPGPQLSGRARHGHVLGAMHHDARRHALQGQGLVYFERCLCSRGCTLTKRGRRGWVLHLVSRPLPSRPIVSPLGGSWAMGTALLTHHLGRLRLASTAISLLWSL